MKRRGPRASWKTPERMAALKAGWEGGMPNADLRAILAAMPGGPLPKYNLSMLASALGIRRPQWFHIDIAPRGKIETPGVQPSRVVAFADTDQDAAEEWGERNGVDPLKFPTAPAWLAAVNGVRRKYGLPEFRLTRMRGRPDPLAPLHAVAP